MDSWNKTKVQQENFCHYNTWFEPFIIGCVPSCYIRLINNTDLKRILIWSFSPEELVNPKSPPVTAEPQSEGDQALYLASDGPILEVVTVCYCWHQHLWGVWKENNIQTYKTAHTDGYVLGTGFGTDRVPRWRRKHWRLSGRENRAGRILWPSGKRPLWEGWTPWCSTGRMAAARGSSGSAGFWAPLPWATGAPTGQLEQEGRARWCSGGYRWEFLGIMDSAGDTLPSCKRKCASFEQLTYLELVCWKSFSSPTWVFGKTQL